MYECVFSELMRPCVTANAALWLLLMEHKRLKGVFDDVLVVLSLWGPVYV